MAAVSAALPEKKGREQVESVVIRFAGDSGDGVQITGGQFTETTALASIPDVCKATRPTSIRAQTIQLCVQHPACGAAWTQRR